MSWRFLPGQAGAYLPGTCSASDASALSKSTSTRGESCSPGRTMEAFNPSQSGTTSRPSTRCRGGASSRSCRADFPAPTSASLVAEQASTARLPGSGHTWPGSFAMFDLASCSWKTAQPSLLGDSAGFSATWPRSGTMRSGACWERPALERRTDETGSGLWPTPTVCGNYNRKGASNASGDGLETAVRTWPTPTARDWRSGKASSETMERNARPLSEVVGGLLNPTWVEWLMGWPLGWTDCAASATARFRSAQPRRSDSLPAAEGGR